jgi:hypothetical protein
MFAMLNAEVQSMTKEINENPCKEEHGEGQKMRKASYLQED